MDYTLEYLPSVLGSYSGHCVKQEGGEKLVGGGGGDHGGRAAGWLAEKTHTGILLSVMEWRHVLR